MIEQTVGTFELEHAIGGQQRGKALLPVVMPTFDFTFGLGGEGIAQCDAIAVQGRAKLGKGIGRVGEEKRVKIHVQCQWQAVGLESPGWKVQMGQQGFRRVEARASVVARGIVEEIEQGLFVWIVG